MQEKSLLVVRQTFSPLYRLAYVERSHCLPVLPQPQAERKQHARGAVLESLG